MPDMICPKCGRNYSDDLLYCLDDGTRLLEVREEPEIETVAHPRIVVEPFAKASQEYCPACGTPNKVGSRFCKKCGQPLGDVGDNERFTPEPPVTPAVIHQESRQKSFAGVIAVIFGLLGIFLLLVIVGLVAYNSSGGGTGIVNANNTPANTPTVTPKPKTPTPSPTTDQSNLNAQTTGRIGKTATLTTDTNLREEPDPNSDKVGTQYKGAKVKVIEVAEVPNDEGGTSIWYHVSVTSYGRSTDPNNSGLDKDPGSADEGWLNSNPKVYDQSKRTQVHKRTVDFDDNK